MTPFMMAVLFVVTALAGALTAALAAAPSEVLIGVQYPIFQTASADYAYDFGGARQLAAFLMALREVNDKADGVMDSILPNTKVKFAFYDSKRDSGNAVVNAANILGSRKLNQEPRHAMAVIGPGSSGESAQAQAVLKLPAFRTAQISYSATSPSLSEHALYPTFLRTAPSDAYQADYVSLHVEVGAAL